MANKLSILLMALMFVATNGLPLPDAASSSLSEEIFPKPLIERFKLLALTLEEFGDMFSELSTKGPAVFEAVLKDPKVLEDTSEEMQKYLKEMRNYVEKFNTAKEEKNGIFDLFDEYKSIVNKFDSDDHPDLSPAGKLIEKSFEKNGLKEIKDAVIRHFELFLKKFTDEVEDYFKGLNENEKKEEKEFIEWFEKLKNEKALEKKFDLFNNFIDKDSNESA